jgi:hypothetical protein
MEGSARGWAWLKLYLGQIDALESAVRELEACVGAVGDDQPGGEGRMIVTVDGMERQDEAIPLVDDRRNRSVEIVSIRSPIRL